PINGVHSSINDTYDVIRKSLKASMQLFHCDLITKLKKIQQDKNVESLPELKNIDSLISRLEKEMDSVEIQLMDNNDLKSSTKVDTIKPQTVEEPSKVVATQKVSNLAKPKLNKQSIFGKLCS